MKVQLYIWANFLSVFVVCIYPEFDLKTGSIRGKYYLTTIKRRTFSAFTGIPYAKPPVGPLRFKEPQPVEGWKGKLDATRKRPICPQKIGDSLTGNEDCLTLNIYTPKLSKYEDTFVPVMVFIHGGAFLGGYSDFSLYGPNLLLNKDVVLVVLNYRLGPLGFLSTGDNVVLGNNGLKDQNCALKWVKSNIQYFGGDANKIIVFGQSAGAVSAHLHLLSPLSKDLLNGVILQSGTALSSWAIDLSNEVLKNTKQLANHFNCSSQDSLTMVECLRIVPAWSIVKSAYFLFADKKNPDIPFKPVIEPNIPGSFLTRPPIEIIEMGKMPNVPIMIGLNAQDGAFKAAGIFGNPKLLQWLNEDFTAALSFRLESDFGTKSINSKIRNLYFKNKDLSTSMRSQVVKMFTDRLFLLPAIQAVELHAKYTNQSVYFYLFGYRGFNSYRPFYGDRQPHDYGVCLGDELLYLFEDREGFPFNTLTESDEEMVKLMTTLWTNFATFGNPTPSTKMWTPVGKENVQYYMIKNYTTRYMIKQNRSKRIKFWENIEEQSPMNLYQTLSGAGSTRNSINYVSAFLFTYIFILLENELLF